MAGNNLLTAKILKDRNTTKGGANALAEQYPGLYGALQGLLGTAQDEVGGSVLDGSHQAQKAGADYGFPVGLLAQMLPSAKLTKGLPVGMSISEYRPQYMNDLVGVLKSGKAQDIPFGSVSGRTEQQLNHIRGILGEPLVQRGNDWLIPKNVVQKVIDKRIVNEGVRPEAFVDDLNSAIHNTGNKSFQSKYPHIQGLLSVDASSTPVAFVGVNPKTGDAVIKSSYRLGTSKINNLMTEGNSLLAGRASAITNPENSGSYRSAIPEQAERDISLSPNKSFVYPQDRALLTAQRNASLPADQGGLGLHWQNTPMERAQAMGMDTPAFHETTGDSAASMVGFDPLREKSSASDFETPYAVFTKPNGAGVGLGGDNVAQMPLMINKGNQAVYRDRGAMLSHAMYDEEFRNGIGSMNRLDTEGARQIDALDSEAERLRSVMRQNPEAKAASDRLNQFLDSFDKQYNEQAAGVKGLLTKKLQNGDLGQFDSVRIMNDAGSFGRSVDNTMVLNPANVRSRFAAFDPMRRDSPDILAGLLPISSMADEDMRSQLLGLLK